MPLHRLDDAVRADVAAAAADRVDALTVRRRGPSSVSMQAGSATISGSPGRVGHHDADLLALERALRVQHLRRVLQPVGRRQRGRVQPVVGVREVFRRDVVRRDVDRVVAPKSRTRAPPWPPQPLPENANTDVVVLGRLDARGLRDRGRILALTARAAAPRRVQVELAAVDAAAAIVDEADELLRLVGRIPDRDREADRRRDPRA